MPARPAKPAARQRKPKAEVFQEFESIQSEVEVSHESADAKTAPAAAVHEAEVRQAVDGVSVEGVVEHISALGLEVSRALAGISAKLVEEVDHLGTVREAIAGEKRERREREEALKKQRQREAALRRTEREMESLRQQVWQFPDRLKAEADRAVSAAVRASRHGSRPSKSSSPRPSGRFRTSRRRRSRALGADLAQLLGGTGMVSEPATSVLRSTTNKRIPKMPSSIATS